MALQGTVTIGGLLTGQASDTVQRFGATLVVPTAALYQYTSWPLALLSDINGYLHAGDVAVPTGASTLLIIPPPGNGVAYWVNGVQCHPSQPSVIALETNTTGAVYPGAVNPIQIVAEAALTVQLTFF